MVSSSTRRAISCIVFLFTLVVLANGQTVPNKELTSTVSGKVTIKGKGAPGIVVGMRPNERVYSSQTKTYRAVTDADGVYRIANVPAGNYNVMTSAPAYNPTDEFGAKTLMIEKGENIENVDFTLVRGGVITGKVVDAEGRPVIEEEVAAVPLPAKGTRNYFQPLSVRTDDRGVYRIYGLPVGSYRVCAGQDEENSYPGRNRASYRRTYHPGTFDAAQAKVIEVTEGSEATNIDIMVSRALTTYVVSGRIVDAETGEPLSGIGYGITRFISQYSTSSYSNGALSNSRGEFKLEGVMPGQYAVTVRPTPNSDWRADSIRFEVVEQDVTGLVLKARKGASLSGVVVLEGGEEKSVREQLNQTGLTASVAGDMNDRPWSNWTVLNPDGSFRLTGLQAGVASFYFPNTTRFRIVRVEHNGVVLPRGIELKEGQQITGLRVVVNYGNASIRGVITLENGPLPENGRFYVMLRKPTDDPRYMGSEPVSQPQVDSRGLFVIDGLMPGAYVLTIGVYVPVAQPIQVETKQDVVVSAGIVTNVNVTLDLKANKPRP